MTSLSERQRLVGKDEVASSNLAISSKASKSLDFGAFSLLRLKSWTSSFFVIFHERMRSILKEIPMNRTAGMSLKSVFEEFVISKTAQGVSEATLNNYQYHMKSIAKYLDIEANFEEVTKRDIEKMVVQMRKKELRTIP